MDPAGQYAISPWERPIAEQEEPDECDLKRDLCLQLADKVNAFCDTIPPEHKKLKEKCLEVFREMEDNCWIAWRECREKKKPKNCLERKPWWHFFWNLQPILIQ